LRQILRAEHKTAGEQGMDRGGRQTYIKQPW
jgi:hypothetical protein